MNGPEKKVVYLAFSLLVVGIVVRILPWGLPAIDQFEIGGDLVVSTPVLDDSSRDEITNKLAFSPRDSLSENISPEKERKPKKERKKKPKVQLPLRINVATAEELCALNGVGPKLAEKMVAFRTAKGPFKSPADLRKVPGIGAKKLEGILPGVIFD